MIERYLELEDLITQVILQVQKERSSKSKAPQIIDGVELGSCTRYEIYI